MTTQAIQQKLSDSKSARWTALLIVSFTMMFGYFFTDVMSPLEPLLTAAKEDGGLGLGWSSDEYGFSLEHTATSMCSSCSFSSVVLSSTSLASVSRASCPPS